MFTFQTSCQKPLAVGPSLCQNNACFYSNLLVKLHIQTTDNVAKYKNLVYEKTILFFVKSTEHNY